VYLASEVLVVGLLDERHYPAGRLGRAAVVLAFALSGGGFIHEGGGKTHLACQNLRT